MPVQFLRVGGYRNNAGKCGAFAANLNNELTNTNTNIGCRLSTLVASRTANKIQNTRY